MIHERFKIRASAAGQIMTNGRAKGTMGKTAQTYCKNWLLEQPEFFDMRVNDFSSIQTSKGNAVEADALDLISREKYAGQFMVPNVTNFKNDYMTGTPDAIMEDHIFDIKSSWSVSTFPFFDVDLPTKDYFWQGQVYMHLTGKKRHIVYYALMDTPDELIEIAAIRRARSLGFSEPTDEIWHDTMERMKYSHIEPSKRIKSFEFDYDPEAIKQLEQRVEVCREYIKELCQTNLKES